MGWRFSVLGQLFSIFTLHRSFMCTFSSEWLFFFPAATLFQIIPYNVKILIELGVGGDQFWWALDQAGTVKTEHFYALDPFFLLHIVESLLKVRSCLSHLSFCVQGPFVIEQKLRQGLQGSQLCTIHSVPCGKHPETEAWRKVERLCVLKWHLSRAFSNPNLLPVWGGNIALGGTPSPGPWGCPALTPLLSRAGCLGQGLQGAMVPQELYPGITRWRISSFREGKHVPSIRAARQRMYTLDKSFKNTGILLRCRFLVGMWVSQKSRWISGCSVCWVFINDTFVHHFHASDVLVECFRGSSWKAHFPYIHSRTIYGKGWFSPLGLCAVPLNPPPHECLYADSMSAADWWVLIPTCPKTSAFPPLFQWITE